MTALWSLCPSQEINSPKGGKQAEGGELFIPLSTQTCRRRPTPNPAPDMNHDPFHFLYPLKIKPLSHTQAPEIPLSPNPHFYLQAWGCVCECVCEGTLCFRKARRTHFLHQIASYIPHSPSICLALAIFSTSFFILLLFFISLWGALSAYRRHKTLIHSSS